MNRSMINRLKISLVLTPLALLLVVGIYIYSLWAAEMQNQADLPFEAVDRMMRDLLTFNQKRGAFPKDLKQMEGVVWDQKQIRNLSNDNRTLNHRNYYYLYTAVNAKYVTIWAIPTGTFRDEAPSWFYVLTPEQCRRWKGPALDFDQLKNVSGTPTPEQLGILGLTEQGRIQFKEAS